MKKLFLLYTVLAGGLSFAHAQETLPDIQREKDRSRLIPISISGYTGEVDSVLKFDLEIAGFSLALGDKAAFTLESVAGAGVDGRLTERSTKVVLFANAYNGGSKRSQAHALADDVVKAVMHNPGIARTKIAFKVDTGQNSEIYVSDYDGFNATPITADHTIVAAPAWAPGHKLIFYTSYKSGHPDIYSHDLGTGERRVIARYSGLNTSATVSPDGKRVAMILSKSGSPDLYVCNLDGSGLKQLTQTREDESSPCWSADGTKICVVSRLNERRGLYIVPAAGGPMTRLRTEGVVNPSEPDWSPDGKTIVFTAQMGGFSICTVPATGGIATLITEGEDPCWAPNSRTVAFARRVKHKRVLSLLDVPTKQVKDVAQSLGSCSQPSWAR